MILPNRLQHVLAAIVPNRDNKLIYLIDFLIFLSCLIIIETGITINKTGTNNQGIAKNMYANPRINPVNTIIQHEINIVNSIIRKIVVIVFILQ